MAEQTPGSVPVVPVVKNAPQAAPAAPGATNGAQPTPTPPDDLSVRLEALKKAERDLQSQRQSWKAEQDKTKSEIEAQRQAYEKWQASTKRAKQDPKSLLDAHGLTYDELTEAMLNDGKPTTGMLAKTVDEIRAEIQAEFDKRDQAREAERTKAEEDRRQASLQVWRRNTAERVKGAADKYPLIAALGAEGQVSQDIEAHYNASGEELAADKAAEALEARLSDLVEKVLALEKYKGRLKPSAPVAAPSSPAAPGSLAEAKAADGSAVAPEQRQHRLRDARPERTTLTNDDAGVTTPINLRGKSPQQAWEELKRSRGLS